MYEINVHQKTRKIPWKDTYILLIPGKPIREDDPEIVEHLRKFHDPANGNGIEIVEIMEPKSVRSMNIDELRELATQMGVEISNDDSRQELMKKIRGERK